MTYKVHVLMPRISTYHVLHHFAKKVCEALRRLGHDSQLFDGQERYTGSLRDAPDFTIGFNGGLPGVQGGFWTDALQIPHVSCLVDPPFRFLKLRESPYIIVTSDDGFFAEKFRSAGFANLFFLAHAVEPELNHDPKEKRIYDVVMLASCIDFEKLAAEWKTKYPKEVIRAMIDAIEITLSDEVTSFVSAFEMTYNACAKNSKNTKVFSVDFMGVLSDIEMYIKGLERVKMIQAIRDVPVHIWGTGPWEKYMKNQPNAILHGEISYEESMKILKKSKVTLNSSLKNKEGAHERIFSGPPCGSLVVTSENRYLRETFQDEKSILFYRYRELNNLNDKVIEFLSDENKRLETVQKAHEIVLKHHTWDHRMSELLNNIENILTKLKI